MSSNVKAGDRFEDRDPRMAERVLEVVEVEAARAVCLVVRGGPQSKVFEAGARPVRIRIDRLTTPYLFKKVTTS